jgi:hypothetical protein
MSLHNSSRGSGLGDEFTDGLDQAPSAARVVSADLELAMLTIDRVSAGDEFLVRELLTRFFRSVEQDLVLLDAVGLWSESSCTHLHRIAGALLGLGATRIGAQCRELSEALTRPPTDDTRIAADDVQALVRQFLCRLVSANQHRCP